MDQIKIMSCGLCFDIKPKEEIDRFRGICKHCDRILTKK